MPGVAESARAPSQLAAGLAAGVAVISSDQTITFTRYQRTVLPLDGYVFWINSGVGGTVAGSLHYATQQDQREDETIGISRVVFTATSPVQCLSEISPNVLFIGTFQGIQFAFSRRESFYEQSGLHHYAGDAVYPALASQLIEDASSLLSAAPIVSNSLPVWLTLNKFMPMYPSFLVPSNIEPPYAAVHIAPDSTYALQAAPHFDSTMTHTQLVSDRVKIVMYGMSNQNALDFQDYVNQYSLNTDVIGIMNIPVIRDEKRTQAELAVIAMKKSFEVEISYYQTRINDVARQFIEKALVQFIISPDPY